MDLVRIAESYFQGLLHTAPAEDAVFQLSSEWRRRATLGGPASLTEVETFADQVLTYAFSVRTGGHWYFFLRVRREDAQRTLVALRDVGLDDIAALLAEALTMCDPYPPLADPAKLLRRTQLVSDDPRFSRLDQEAWRAPIYEALLVFLRARADEVLRPERGLSGHA